MKLEYFIKMISNVRYIESDGELSLANYCIPFRMYSFRSMSDKTDGLWGMYATLIALNQYAVQNSLPDKSYEFITSVLETRGDKDYCFISSWTSKEDDMDMWKKFGDNGNGVQICIPENRLLQIKDLSDLQLRECDYISVDEYISSNDISRLYGMTDGQKRTYCINILENSKWKKYKGLSNEQEIRIIKNINDNITPQIDDKQRQYIEIYIPLSAISSVTLGYNINYDNERKKIENILSREGVESELLHMFMYNVFSSKYYCETINID